MIFPRSVSLTRSLYCPQSNFTHSPHSTRLRFATIWVSFCSLVSAALSPPAAGLFRLACEVETAAGLSGFLQTQAKTPASPLCSAKACAFFYIGRKRLQRLQASLFPPYLRSQLQSFRCTSFLPLEASMKLSLNKLNKVIAQIS